ncbi:MAG: HypC/HybG/HupF family hydrogenase formation chaperone [Candidatus Woesearchaeota archaeon]
MCFAIPGKIIEIKDDQAVIEYFTNEKRTATLIQEDEYKVGDYVFVSAEIVVQKLSEKEALESIKVLKNEA